MAQRLGTLASHAMSCKSNALTTLAAIDAEAWNALAGDSPFMQHEFLIALEHSGCVGAGTAWQPCYLARARRGTATRAARCRSI